MIEHVYRRAPAARLSTPWSSPPTTSASRDAVDRLRRRRVHDRAAPSHRAPIARRSRGGSSRASSSSTCRATSRCSSRRSSTPWSRRSGPMPPLDMGTAARPIADDAELSNPHVVKVVCDAAGMALYFSRAPIPYGRDRSAAAATRAHVGLYVYRRDVAAAPVALPPAPLEQAEIARAAARARARHPHQRRRHAVPTRSASIRRRISNACQAADVRRRRGSDDMTMDEQRPTKYIFVTGGVVSSLGKGLAAASIGALLEGHGYKVTLQKFDPYINVDPGHDEPVSARRGLRHRRRRGDGPRPGPLRALHEHDRDAQQQLDDRQDLHVGDPEGAPRRLPRPHRAGDPAHHQRDQGLHPRRPGATSTSCSSRSAARSATSRACRSSRRSASSARTSAARTPSTST